MSFTYSFSFLLCKFSFYNNKRMQKIIQRNSNRSKYFQILIIHDVHRAGLSDFSVRGDARRHFSYVS
jgi:hypothetical protein